MKPDATIHRYFCNACQRMTRHVQRAVHMKKLEDPESDEWADGTWSVWECLGCEQVLFTESWEFSYDLDPNTGEIEPKVSFYPPRSSHQARKKTYQNIPRRLDAIYAEVIDTFNAGSHILCAGGLRALLEGICVERDPSVAGPKVRLDDKIDKALKSAVPESILQNLRAFGFLGNPALHELERPEPAALALAIEVMEDVLNLVYELDYKSGSLYRLVSTNKKTPVEEL